MTVLDRYRRAERRGTLRRLLGPVPWCVDNLEQLPSEIRFSGWALSPDPGRIALTWNGQPVTGVE
jgi:hypothetical protein